MCNFKHMWPYNTIIQDMRITDYAGTWLDELLVIISRCFSDKTFTKGNTFLVYTAIVDKHENKDHSWPNSWVEIKQDHSIIPGCIDTHRQGLSPITPNEIKSDMQGTKIKPFSHPWQLAVSYSERQKRWTEIWIRFDPQKQDWFHWFRPNRSVHTHEQLPSEKNSWNPPLKASYHHVTLLLLCQRYQFYAHKE